MKLNSKRLFEFNECSWMPSKLREYSTDFLSSLWCFDGFGMTQPAITPAIKLMEKSVKKAKAKTIVDLASGSGKASVHILNYLKSKGFRNLNLVLTDLYPNLDSFKKLSGRNVGVSYKEESVDAMSCEIEGFRTFFASFHHFDEQGAKTILQDAISKKEGVGIFEMTNKGFWNLFLLIGLAPLWVILLTPIIRPFTFTRILFTYLIPIVPLMLWWDGFVSVLRTYSEKEIKRIIKSADPNNTYDWEITTNIYGLPEVFAMVGYPKKPKPADLIKEYGRKARLSKPKVTPFPNEEVNSPT